MFNLNENIIEEFSSIYFLFCKNLLFFVDFNKIVINPDLHVINFSDSILYSSVLFVSE